MHRFGEGKYEHGKTACAWEGPQRVWAVTTDKVKLSEQVSLAVVYLSSVRVTVGFVLAVRSVSKSVWLWFKDRLFRDDCWFVLAVGWLLVCPGFEVTVGLSWPWGNCWFVLAMGWLLVCPGRGVTIGLSWPWGDCRFVLAVGWLLVCPGRGVTVGLSWPWPDDCWFVLAVGWLLVGPGRGRVTVGLSWPWGDCWFVLAVGWLLVCPGRGVTVGLSWPWGQVSLVAVQSRSRSPPV